MATYWTPPTSTPNPPPASPPPSNSTPGGGSGNTGGGGGGGGGGGSSGGGGGGMSAAEKRAIARQKKAERKAAKRYTEKAELLKKQANALRLALGNNGALAKARDTKIKNVKLAYTEEDKLILEQFGKGKADLQRQAELNTETMGEGTVQATSNAARERSEAMAQSIQQGVGASDILRAQAASLRNWQFNMAGVLGEYGNVQSGIESSGAELENTIMAQRTSAWREREGQIGTARNTYNEQRGEVLTDIGNLLGESSTYYDMANEQVGSKSRKKKSNRAERQALEAFRRAARASGMVYSERATPDRIKDWESGLDLAPKLDSRRFATPEFEVKEAEGATLRRWET
jgi:hypothetical protein